MKCSNFVISTVAYSTNTQRNWKESNGKESVWKIMEMGKKEREEWGLLWLCSAGEAEKIRMAENLVWQVIIFGVPFIFSKKNNIYNIWQNCNVCATRKYKPYSLSIHVILYSQNIIILHTFGWRGLRIGGSLTSKDFAHSHQNNVFKFTANCWLFSILVSQHLYSSV